MMSEIPRMSSPSLPSLFTLVFIFLFYLSTTAAGGDHHRHLLHQPFFPVLNSPPPPPAISPSPSPTAQPTSSHHHHNHSQPQKHPFSSVPTPNAPPQNQPNPFFPSTDAASSSPPPPPSPPPPSTTLATFPANISSLLLPSTSSHQHHHVKKLLAITISAVSAVLILSLLAFLILLRRHRRFSSPSTAAVPDDTKSARSDSLRLFNTAPSDSTQHLKQIPPKYTSSNTSSEFLYLGTLVNSRSGGIDQQNAAVSGVLGIPFPASSSSSSQYQKLGSPELRPLPPLPKYNAFTPNYLSGEQLNPKRDDENDDGDNNEENDEFFSPRGSSGRKQSPTRVLSSSRRDLQGIGVDHFGSTSFNSRTASYPYSNSCSPSNSMSSSTASPGTNPSLRSLKSKSPDSIINFPVQQQPTNPSPTPFPSFSLAQGSAQNEIDRIYETQSRNAQNDSVPRYLAPKRPPPPPPPPRFSEIPVETAVSQPNDANLGFAATIKDQGNEGTKENEELVKKEEALKPKLKPLHWDKVRASSSHVMVWDQIKSNSFQLNEEMIETLFRANDPNLKAKDNGGRQVVQSLNHETRVLDPKKSQNIAILLRALNVTADEVCEALMEGNADTLGPELLECLLKMAPTKVEERKLNEFRDDDESPFKLGPAERFLKALLNIPFAFERVDSMLYIVNFDSEIEYLNRSFMTLEAACGELRNTRMFLKLLEAVLKTGNRMNVGTNRGDAHAFKLDTLLKLVDIKGTDGKTTLLHFVVQEITKSEGSRLSGKKQSTEMVNKTEQSLLHDDIELRKLGLQVVSSLGSEMTNVKKAAAMDSDVLNNEITKIASGITKVKEIIKLNEESAVSLIDEKSIKFLESMNVFLNRAQEDIAGIEARGRNAFSMVKEATDYFHGNSSKEEAHPFRIFAVVRDFLSILDRVCKEVGKINDRTFYGTARPAPASQNGPQLFPELHGRQEDSSFSDDDSSG